MCRSKKAIEIRLIFAYDEGVPNALHAPFVFDLRPSLTATNAALTIGIGS